MLDLGVGAGRTAHTFAALTKSYVGIDYAARMIDLSREAVREDARVRFEVGDARDLSRFQSGQFGFVLFSHNGIDYGSYRDRSGMLSEIHRVLAHDGRFLFSSHSLEALPFRFVIPPISPHRLLRSVYSLGREIRYWLREVSMNRHLDLDEAHRRGWALVRDRAHGFSIASMYVQPQKQVAQLEANGFSVTDVMDPTGHSVDPARPGRSPFLHYLCRPQAD
jgi:SAM-dependent methyltransferase